MAGCMVTAVRITWGDWLAADASGARRVAREAGLIVAGTALLALSARVFVPVGPVPATLQTFAVLLIGALLGSRRAGLTLATYLLEGACGLPVFAGGTGGPAVLLGPTAGYLWSFPAAAYLVGRRVERGGDLGIVRALLVLLLGDAVILAGGVAWLAAGLGWNAALAVGAAPFVIWNIVKIGLTACVLPLGRRGLERVVHGGTDG